MPQIERQERLAINLYDLDRIDPTLRAKLLAGRLDLGHPMKTDWDRTKGEEEVAVLFICSLLEAAIICDTIRSLDKAAGDFPTRLYLKRKSWSRVPSYAILSVVEDGKCRLNPKVFRQEVDLIPHVPRAPRRVSFGKRENQTSTDV